jgi:polar amino acid transport system substrate-binding protein
MTVPRIALLLCLSFLLPAAAADTTLSGCGHPAYPPWNWEHRGQIIGTCADVARRAFAAAGLSLKLDYVGPWARCQAMVERGDVDVNICAFDNPKRRETSVIVEPAMGRNEAAVFVRRGSPLKFERWQDLQGQRVGMVHGVSLGAEFDTFLLQHTQLDRALSEALNMRKLLAGRLDAVTTGRELGLLTLSVLGCQHKIEALPQPVLVGELFIQMSKRSPHLAALPKVQAFLLRPEYKAQLAQLHRHYTELYTAQQAQAPIEACDSP